MQPVHVLHLLLLKPIMLMLFGDVFQKIGIKPVTFGAPWQTKCRWMLKDLRQVSAGERGDYRPIFSFCFIQFDHQVGQFGCVEEDHIPNVHWYYDP